MVREPLVHRNDIPGEPRASRRRNATSMVRPRHSADDAGAVRVVFARYAMGGRSQNRRQPSPEISRVVSQTRTFLQRRHGRRSKTLLERAEFFNVSASAGQCRNSNRPHGKTHGSALLRGIKSAKSSLGRLTPSFVQQCHWAISMGRDLIGKALSEGMFKDNRDANKD